MTGMKYAPDAPARGLSRPRQQALREPQTAILVAALDATKKDGEEIEMTAMNTITISVHEDGQWSIRTETPHSGEPERSIGGQLEVSRVISTATEWIRDIAPPSSSAPHES